MNTPKQHRIALIPVLLLLALVWHNVAFAQEVETTIHFELDKFEHIDTLHNNAVSYSELDKMLTQILADSSQSVQHITISGNTSPEAGKTYNKVLSTNRANAVREYITTTYKIDSSLISIKGKGTQWNYLYNMVSESNIPYRDAVLNIINSVEEETWTRVGDNNYLSLTDSRLKRLMDFQGGKAYKHLFEEFFPLMRSSDVVIQVVAVLKPYEIKPTNYELKYTELDIEFPTTSPQEDKKGYSFALKSNLIYDAVSVTNIELEFPIKQHISITGEYAFPWWYNPSSNFTMRTHMFHLGVNYWLGNRDKREVLTGWHIGIMAGYANQYDMQLFDMQGVQGDYKMVGINAGYAHKIYKSLRLEYQLGLGYMTSQYRNYSMAYATSFGNIKVFDYPWAIKRKTWIGPTQARVSLAWLINCKKRESNEK